MGQGLMCRVSGVKVGVALPVPAPTNSVKLTVKPPSHCKLPPGTVVGADSAELKRPRGSSVLRGNSLAVNGSSTKSCVLSGRVGPFWFSTLLVLLLMVELLRPGRRDDVGQSPPKTGGKATRSTNAASVAASADTMGLMLVRPCRGCRRMVRRRRVRGGHNPRKVVTNFKRNALNPLNCAAAHADALWNNRKIHSFTDKWTIKSDVSTKWKTCSMTVRVFAPWTQCQN